MLCVSPGRESHQPYILDRVRVLLRTPVVYVKGAARVRAVDSLTSFEVSREGA